MKSFASPLPVQTAAKSPVLAFPAYAISSTKVKEGRAFCHANFFYFTYKDGVITCRVGLRDDTVQIGKGIGNYRYATFHVAVMYSQAAGSVGIPLRIGEEFGERLLLLEQYADTKPSALTNMQIGFGQVVDAHQYQRRVQRNRTE